LKRALSIVIAAAALAAVGCAGAAKLPTEDIAGPPVEEGTYTVFLYSASQSEGSEGPRVIKGLVAILDLEGDDYEFDLSAPEFDFGTVRGLTGPEAVRSGEWFIGREHFGELAYSRILAGGITVGYEIRPEYKQIVSRRLVMDVDYFLAGGNRVRVVFGVGHPAGGGEPY
jgi:hypothetical protein